MAVRPGKFFRSVSDRCSDIRPGCAAGRRAAERQLDIVLMLRHPLADLPGPVHAQVVNDQEPLAGRILDQAPEEGNEKASVQRSLEANETLHAPVVHRRDH